MRYRVRFVALALASFVFSFLGSFFASGAFPHRLMAIALCSVMGFQSNACLAQLPIASERAVAAVSMLPAEKPSHNNDEQKVAGFPFGGIKLPIPNIPGGGGVQEQVNQAAYQKIGEALGAKAAVNLDAKSQTFKKVDEIRDFHPTPLRISSLRDLLKPLPPGDYSLELMSFCTQWSVHVAGYHTPYTLGRADGSRIGAITTFLIRGQLAGLTPDQLHNVTWAMQIGAPLSQWRDEDRDLIHRFAPEFEAGLQGDIYDQLKGEYERVRHTAPTGLPDFDGFVSKVPLGRQYQTLRQAQKIITDRSIASQEVGNRLYDATAEKDGKPQVLPAYSGNQTPPWSEIKPGVYGRYTLQNARAGAGSNGINLFEFRVTKDAGKSASAEGVKVAMAGSDVAFIPILVAGVVAAGEIIFDAEVAAEVAAATEAAIAAAERKLLEAMASGRLRPLIAYGKQAVQALVSVARMYGDDGNENNQQGNNSPKVPDRIVEVGNKIPEAQPGPQTTIGRTQKQSVIIDGEKYIGGDIFENRQGSLPSSTADGKPITYKEYDVNPYQPGVNRGDERIVIGSDSMKYYTSDHYRTFTHF